MAMSRHAAILSGQLRAATKDPNEYVKFYMSEDDPSTWYCLLYNFSGDNDEFVGGEYLVRVDVSEKTGFPYKPPHFYFMTPNGVYDIETKVCISIGEYHPGEYRASLKVSGFVNQLWNGMIGWSSLGHGIHIVSDIKVDNLKKFAAGSKQYNREKYPELIAKIESFYDTYAAKWDKSTMPEPMLKRLGFAASGKAEQP